MGDYEGVREDLEAMMPGASAHGSFAMALVQREQEFASDCARCGHLGSFIAPPLSLFCCPTSSSVPAPCWSARLLQSSSWVWTRMVILYGTPSMFMRMLHMLGWVVRVTIRALPSQPSATMNLSNTGMCHQILCRKFQQGGAIVSSLSIIVTLPCLRRCTAGRCAAPRTAACCTGWGR